MVKAEEQARDRRTTSWRTRLFVDGLLALCAAIAGFVAWQLLTDYAETARAVLAGYAVICLGVVAMWRLWPRVARLLTSLIWVLSIPQAVYAMLPFVMAGGHEFADRPNASDVATMGYTVLFFVMGAAVVLLILGQCVLWRRHR